MNLSPLCTFNGLWGRNYFEKGNFLVDHLSAVFTPSDDNSLIGIPPTVQPEFDNLNTRKAAGINQISNKMFQDLSRAAVRVARFIFIVILRLQYFPKE